MLDSAQALVEEHAALERQMGEPAIASDPDRSRELGKRYAALGPTVAAHQAWVSARDDLGAARELAAEEPAFATEIPALEATLAAAEDRLRRLLIPRDPDDDRDVILEVKAGEGGEESALFAGDLLRMYLRHAERRGWRTDVLDSTESDLGGYKDVRVAVKARGNPQPGEAPWARLKFEGGVHRVQRVPVTESQGRIHTSAAGVWVMPEAEDVEVTIDPHDLRIDVFRSSGPGGQSVNTTDSAVRITHLPTNIVVTCQNERSQLQNKAAAMQVLAGKLLERQRADAADERARLTGGPQDVSFGSQIRNYVLHPYQMVKDLRTEEETGNTGAVLDGDIDGFIDAEIRWRRPFEV